jgi:hypothetical protein
VKRNYNVVSTIEVLFEGRVIDLHSGRDCTAINILPADQRLVVQWGKKGGDSDVQIEFLRVSFLAISGFDTLVPRSEDKRLSFIGYVHPEDKELMNGFLLEEMSSIEYHMIISFEGGMTLKIYAEDSILSLI